jgi:cAMP-dependent protein kinase regulator
MDPLLLPAVMTAAVLLAAGYLAARCAVGYAGSRLAIVYALLAGVAVLLAGASLGTVLAAAGPARMPEVLGRARSLLALAAAGLIVPRAWAAWKTASHSGWVLSLAGVAGLGAAGLLPDLPAAAAALTVASALCLAGGTGLCWRAWGRACGAEAPVGRAGQSDVARLQYVFAQTAACVRGRVKAVGGARGERALVRTFNRDTSAAGWPVSLTACGVDDGLADDVPIGRRAAVYASALNLLLDVAARQIGKRLSVSSLQAASSGLPADARELAAAYLYPQLRYPALPGEERRDERGDYAQLLRQIPLFAGMDDTEIDLLCANLNLERFGPGRVVIRQGEPGDSFYVVREGHIEVSQAEGAGRARVVNSLDRGDYFGEAALLSDAPRNATCRTTMRTELLSLRRADFRRLLGSDLAWQARTDDALARLALLRGIPVFSQLDVHQLGLIAAKLRAARYRRGEVILREGEQADAFYIIRGGRIAITTAAGGVETPVEERGPGEYIGEIALLQRGPRTATARALTDLDVWLLDAADFDRVVARQVDARPRLQREAARRLGSLRRRDGRSV